MTFWSILACLLSGFCASMGLGGGSVLVIYLTIVEKIPQLSAQGINLLFFIPSAIVSVIINAKNNLVDLKKALFMILGGLIGVLFGIIVLSYIPKQYGGKLFGAFLIIFGLKILFSKTNNTQKSDN